VPPPTPTTGEVDAEVRVYSPTRRPLASFGQLTGLSISWQRNGASAATWSIPRTARWYNPELVSPHNRIEIHHRLLPVVWTGVLLDYGGTGPDVTLTAQSAEWLFTKRYTARWLQVVGVPGTVAGALLRQAESSGYLGVTAGDLDLAGPPSYREYSLKRISEALQSLAAESGGDYWIEKREREHSAPWRFMWSGRRGRDRRGMVLLGPELTDPPQYNASGQEQATAVHTIGGGTGPSIEQRMYLFGVDPASRDRYGHLEELIEYPDVIDLATLEALDNAERGRRAKPAHRVGFNINNSRSMWGTFWIGDTIRSILPTVGPRGYDGAARIDAIQVDAGAGRMGLVVELLEAPRE
jgi:hypothetical protein